MQGRLRPSEGSPTKAVRLRLSDLTEVASRAHAEIDRGEPEVLPPRIVDLDPEEALAR